MSRFLWRTGGLIALGVLGLSMAFYSLERLALINLATTLGQDDGKAPLAVTISLFVGLVLVFLATFFGMWRWARYLRENPRTPQAPVWLLLSVLGVGGAAMIWALATHSGWLRIQETVLIHVHWGYIAFQVVAASFVLIPLVLLAVRWAPGYKNVHHTEPVDKAA